MNWTNQWRNRILGRSGEGPQNSKRSKESKGHGGDLPPPGAQYEDIQIMIEMGYEENDPSMIPEIQEMLDEFINSLEDIRTKQYAFRESMITATRFWEAECGGRRN